MEKHLNNLLKTKTNEEVLELLKNDFENFHKQTGRYPTVQEIDKGSFIVTSRTIQRRLGGIKKVRELLGLEILDYTKGETRSNKAKMYTERGLTTEGKVLDILVKRFPIQTIHQQARYHKNNRCDFLVYNKTKYFYIDVFYTESYENFNSILNFKLLKYNVIKDYPVYFVVEGLDQKSILQKLKYKKTLIPNNFKVMALEELEKEILPYIPFTLS